MSGEIIAVFVIVAAAVGYMGYTFFRFLKRSKNSSMCAGCSCTGSKKNCCH